MMTTTTSAADNSGDGSCVSAVGENGSVALLAYLHDECGFPWDEERSYGVAIRHGRMDCVRYLYAHAGPPDESACQSAVMQGDMEALQFLVERGCPCGPSVLSEAADNQNLEMLRYLREKAGCAWGRTTCADAVSCWRSDEADDDDDNDTGIACLRYLHEQGCPRDDDVAVARAIEYGRPRCLRYLRDVVGCSG